ncbi:MAG: GNAT family N-acetyltransferase [Bacteroidales bacterium]
MKLQSVRLDIAPLGLEELKTFIQSRQLFEKQNGFKLTNQELHEAYAEELTETIQSKPDAWQTSSYIYYTLWLIIERNTKTIIGQFTFNGKPTAKGEVEVFFSIDSDFRQKGYGCEAMEAILRWAEKTKPFKVVLIEADLNNKAAMSSLKKLKFCSIQPDDHVNTKYYKTVCKDKSTDNNLDFDSFSDCYN